MKLVLPGIEAAGGDVIGFVDELYTLVGVGAAEGAMDASNMSKPALARGELYCVGTITLDEYRKNVEKDAALAWHLQRVIQRAPQNAIASLIIEGRVGEGALVPISAGDEGLFVNGEVIEVAAV